MRDDAFDVCKVGVRGGRRTCQHELGVENIQTLVLHRAHIEVACGNDHEAFEVEGQVKARLVPHDAGHQGIHGVLGFIEIARADVDLQQVRLTAARRNPLLTADQIARD